MNKRRIVSILELGDEAEVSIKRRGKWNFYRISRSGYTLQSSLKGYKKSYSYDRLLSLWNKENDISLISNFTGRRMNIVFIYGE